MELRLTTDQLAHLRRERLNGKRNKIDLALRLRGANGQDLAAAAHLQKSKVSELRNGKYSRISLDMARKLADVFGACVEDLFPPPCVRRKRAA